MKDIIGICGKRRKRKISGKWGQSQKAAHEFHVPDRKVEELQCADEKCNMVHDGGGEVQYVQYWYL